MSTGAKAGIGAGVAAVALIALVVLGLFLLRRRKRRAAPSSELENPYAGQYSDDTGHNATKYGHVGVNEKPELDSNSNRAELPMYQAPPAELSGGDVPRSELAGGEAPQGGQIDGTRM